MAQNIDPTLKNYTDTDPLAFAVHDIADSAVVDRFISEFSARSPDTAHFVLSAIIAANGLGPETSPKYAFMRGVIFQALADAGIQANLQLEQLLTEPSPNQPSLFDLDPAA